MGKITTGLIDIFSPGSPSTDNWIPATGPINSATVQNVLFGVELRGITDIKVRPGVQFSKDGITWSDAPKAIDLDTSPNEYATTAGWTYAASTDDIFNLSGVTPRLFCRFGFGVRNGSGSNIESGKARLRVACKPTNGKSYTAGPAKVNSDGTTTPIFNALTGAIPTEGIDEIRGTLEMVGDSGDCEAQIAYQLSHDGVTWDTAVTFESVQNGNGTTWGTTFASVTWNKDFVRFGAVVDNGTAGSPQAAQVTIRVDVR